jgi:hypothetical protein
MYKVIYSEILNFQYTHFLINLFKLIEQPELFIIVHLLLQDSYSS